MHNSQIDKYIYKFIFMFYEVVSIKKTIVSVSLDFDVVKQFERINKGKVSQVINETMRRAFMTPEGIQEQINEYKDKINLLEAELYKLRHNNLFRMDLDRPELYALIEQAHAALERSPTYIRGQTNTINNMLNEKYSEDEVLVLINKFKQRKEDQAKQQFDDKADALFAASTGKEQPEPVRGDSKEEGQQ